MPETSRRLPFYPISEDPRYRAKEENPQPIHRQPRNTILGLSPVNIKGLSDLNHGLHSLYWAVDARRFGIDWSKVEKPFEYSNLGVSALRLLPLARRVMNSYLEEREILPDALEPYIPDLKSLAEGILEHNSIERRLLLEHTPITAVQLKPYADQLGGLQRKRNWVVRGATLAAAIAPAAIIPFAQEVPVCLTVLGAVGGSLISAAIVHGEINSRIDARVTEEASKLAARKLPEAVKLIPTSLDITPYRALVESAIPTEYPAQDFRKDCEQLFNEARQFAYSEADRRGRNSKWGEDFIYALKSEYNSFVEDPNRYPFFKAALETYRRTTGQRVRLGRIYPEEDLEATAILAPEIYLSLAYMANVWSGNENDDNYYSEEYWRLKHSGSIKRSLAMNFSGTVYERYGVDPEKLSRALITTAKGLSRALPENRQEVLDDFDKLAQQIAQVQEKNNLKS